MKYFLILFLTLFLTVSSFSQNSQNDNNKEITTYYLIRHAEKDRSDKSVKNPHLTNKGLTRAKNWANTLKHVPFNAVYSTDYFRTLETAQPLAENKELKIIIYNPRSLDIKKFKKETKGKTVLIVGHSNTTPMLVNMLLGKKKYNYIDDANNSNLYIVSFNGNKIHDILLVVD